jgi:hypothetical protein
MGAENSITSDSWALQMNLTKVINPSDNPSVFLDTKVLWRDYLLFLTTEGKPLNRWYYEITSAITFTKCIYELWRLGKSVTKREIQITDDDSIKHITALENAFVEKYPNLHVGNQVLSKSDPFTLYEVTTYRLINDPFSLHPLSRPRIPALKDDILKKAIEFDDEYQSFRDSVDKFLTSHSIFEVSYYQVFGQDLLLHIPKESVRFGDLFEHLNIPSEDLEITLAAISVEATFFITGDLTLLKNWKSIGLNAHYPQPIFLNETGKLSKSEIIAQWRCTLEAVDNLSWPKSFLEYTNRYPAQFVE